MAEASATAILALKKGRVSVAVADMRWRGLSSDCGLPRAAQGPECPGLEISTEEVSIAGHGS